MNGYYLLGKDWLETSNDWKQRGVHVPPAMITVANRTETAARIKYAFDHGKIRIDELRAPERTLHIDSKVLEQAESQDEPVAFFETAPRYVIISPRVLNYFAKDFFKNNESPK